MQKTDSLTITVIKNNEYGPQDGRDRTEYRDSKGQLHRLDGPAVEYTNDDYEWWLNGKRHRVDGPAVYIFGYSEWYQDGLLHRDDGPSFEGSSEVKKWYQKGKLHRFDGPAYIFPDEFYQWFFNGKRHRVDGPAVEWANGEVEWYLYGFSYKSEEEWFNVLTEQDQVNYLFKKQTGYI